MALPKSHSQSVLPNPRLLVLETIEQFEDRFLLTVRVQQVPLCPECGRASESRHSHYVRRLQESAVAGSLGPDSPPRSAFPLPKPRLSAESVHRTSRGSPALSPANEPARRDCAAGRLRGGRLTRRPALGPLGHPHQ